MAYTLHDSWREYRGNGTAPRPACRRGRGRTPSVVGQLEQLVDRIALSLAELDGDAAQVVGGTAQRCRDSLERAIAALEQARTMNRTQAGEELTAAELRLALDEIGRVAGVVYTDDLLDRIFSRFCIGK